MFSEAPWRRVLRVAGVLGFIVAVLATVFMNEAAILFIQNEASVPGKTIKIGVVRFSRNSSWLLLSSRSENGKRERLYGILPVFHQYGPSGRYFSFRDTTDNSAQNFIVSESDENTLRWAHSTLSDEQALAQQVDCKRIFIEQYKQMSLKCTKGEYSILYLPNIGIEIVESVKSKTSTLPHLIQ